jgi:patatin-like phospholipase/acyl hydrolase
MKKSIIKSRILSIDGGGVRGIVPAVMLSHLEDKLQQLSGDTNVRIVDYFDLFAGTSTGGLIIAALLTPDEKTGRPKYSAKQIVDMYFEDSKDIFHASLIQCIRSVSGMLDVKYAAGGIESTLDKYFGNYQLTDLLKPCLIPAYNLTQGCNYFFRQHKARVNSDHNYYIKDALRAATAAITYFPPAEIKTVDKVNQYCFIDGGVFAINPSLSIYAEFRHLNHKFYSKNTMLLSLGTGKQDTCLKCDDIENWGAVEWRDPGSGLITTAMADASSYQLRAVYDSSPNYLRINPYIDKSHVASLDDTNDEYLKFLRALGEQAIKDNQTKLNEFAEQLVKGKFDYEK